MVVPVALRPSLLAEEPLFARKAARVAAERPISTGHSVTGYQRHKGIPVERVAYRASCMRTPNLLGHPSVRSGLAFGNQAHRTIDLLLKPGELTPGIV